MRGWGWRVYESNPCLLGVTITCHTLTGNMWWMVGAAQSQCVCLFFVVGRKNRGEAEEGGSTGTSWRTHRGQGTPHNEAMCGECLSGRIAAPRTILPAVIKGRQVPILSVTQGFHLNVPLSWKLTLLTLLTLLPPPPCPCQDMLLK